MLHIINKYLLNLEKFLHNRVIGQDEAVREISDSLRRARAGLKSKNNEIWGEKMMTWGNILTHRSKLLR